MYIRSTYPLFYTFNENYFFFRADDGAEKGSGTIIFLAHSAVKYVRKCKINV